MWQGLVIPNLSPSRGLVTNFLGLGDLGSPG